MEKTSTGLNENVAGLLCYVCWWLTGIIFLIIEKENKTVRFHAAQAIITFGALCIAAIIIGWIPFIGWIIGGIIWVIAVVLWIVLMIKAYQGAKFKVPVAGNFAEKWVG